MATLGIVIAIVVYLAALLIMGATFAKDNQTIGDYYLGGRKLGPFVTAMSAEASDMSSWLLMGLPGIAYASGICDVFWTALGLGIGTYVNWLIVAKRLRKYSEKNNSVTIPDFFEHRFRDKSHILMVASSLIIVVFFVPYVGSGFAACGKLFSSLFGLDYTIAMLVSAAVIIGYTATGGFTAASVTDFIQSIIMTIALIAVVCFGLSTVGALMILTVSSNKFPIYGLITIISTMAWGLGYFGMPHILLRFMAIEDPEKIKLSRRISTVWVFIAMGVAIFIGVMTRTMVHAGALPELEDSERAIVIIAQTLAEHGFLASLLAGVILAGILACTMSTCDSQMLAASSSVSENILHETFGIELSEHMQMVMARIVLIAIAVVGVIIARDPNSSVFGIVSFAWAGFGAAFGPIMLLALFWKRTNRYGAIAGMIGGGVMIFIWKFLIKPLGGVFGIYELLPGFIVALVLCVVVSLLTPAPEQEIVDEFNSVS